MLRSALLIAFVFRDASCCDLVVLDACVSALTEAINSVVIAQGSVPTPLQKEAQCAAVTHYETCFSGSTVGCDPATTNKLRLNLESTRTYLSTKYGNECNHGSVPKNEIQLSSGDSGSRSGSEPRASSNSAYGFLLWQMILGICCVCLCCAGAGGGGAYYSQNKKKANKKPKAMRPTDDFEAARPEEVPLASAMVDVNNDGIPDLVVTGVDRNRDGIPDALQGDMNAPMVVEPLAKDGETVLTAPANAGDMILQVASQNGFAPGQQINIGGLEVNSIAGFGSIVLTSPLKLSHPAGAPVTVIGNISETPLFGMPQPLMSAYAPTTYSTYPTQGSYYTSGYAAPTTYATAPTTTSYSVAAPTTAYAGASYASPTYTTGATYAAPATYAAGYPAGGVY